MMNIPNTFIHHDVFVSETLKHTYDCHNTLPTTGVYLFQLVHVLLYFFASIRGSSELVCPFFQYIGVNFSVFCLYCIDAARIQSGLQL